MKTTKDEILIVSLQLFAEKGFDSVSTSMIAEKLGLTKGALYRHYKNKKEIYDSIIKKMYQLDHERANEDSVPENTYEEMPNEYVNINLEDFLEFTNNQLVFWTLDPFASLFRKMITIEQYKSEEAKKIYQEVIGMGPIKYTMDLLNQMIKENKLNEDAKNFGAQNLAFELFSPLKLAIELYDGGIDIEELKKMLKSSTNEFKKRWSI